MLDKERIPAHVAIVMDGNGRWAARKNLPRMAGHRAGMKAMKEIVKKSSALGVGYLTVYAFSTENWKRSREEVGGIFNLLVYFVDHELKELHQNNVKVTILGNYKVLPFDAVERIDRTLELTKDNTGLHFSIALNYGSRLEILDAVKRLAAKVVNGEESLDQLDADRFSDELYTGKFGIPDPDLVIRTSGEKRLSNFLLWQSAYSEFVFTDTQWPDFTPEIYEGCIEEYQGRDRRFGGRPASNQRR